VAVAAAITENIRVSAIKEMHRPALEIRARPPFGEQPAVERKNGRGVRRRVKRVERAPKPRGSAD
jgi:hypothetical protein